MAGGEGALLDDLFGLLAVVPVAVIRTTWPVWLEVTAWAAAAAVAGLLLANTTAGAAVAVTVAALVQARLARWSAGIGATLPVLVAALATIDLAQGPLVVLPGFVVGAGTVVATTAALRLRVALRTVSLRDHQVT